ncbi:class A beta-lactamase [Priestia megaterium]|uniref:class A beta-lactamase n=1 Tax=Priestia megaterium TaxID=1404 RepID=UPI0009906352|nr:class A beta-lactamase [Priestia megaterium]AQU77073.1 class A beta-lactamase [Priestia megaterium]PFI66856.1 class A beta-lactamase [Priestia megaterium]PGK60212.1 class A beta-lactamase [Priestia megaterium]PGN02562.1 class A beta-lactamase [Priestia megaterium]QSF35941.1 class A beta-lactamase [Priestia megaterium]
MKSWNTVFRPLKFKKIVPALLLTCVTLAGCSEGNDQSVQAKQKNQESVIKHHFVKLEDKFDARLGVFALDTSTNQTVTYRADERFIYASTSKALAVGALLQQKTIDDLNQRITYTQDDLVNYNPITEKHVDTGMTLKELCDAALRYSDNTAMNLILKQIGGPNGLEKSLRDVGDNVTMPEQFEPELNDVKPGETHDTSTPRALATSLQSFTLGDVLPIEKRELLIDWMKRNTTGDSLIRAGVPKGWVVADKTGSGSYGTRNDIAIIWPPKGDPIMLAILSSRDKKDANYNDKLIAEATKEVINAYQAIHK